MLVRNIKVRLDESVLLFFKSYHLFSIHLSDKILQIPVHEGEAA